MAQGLLPFKYEEERKESGLTGLAGLPLYVELMAAMGFPGSIGEHVRVKKQGWTDSQTVLSLILLNLAGGDSVDDLGRLESDEGFCKVLRRVEQTGLKRRQRRELERRWRKDRCRTVPSPSSVFRFLAAFHDGEQEAHRIAGKAFVPRPNQHLQGLMRVNAGMLRFLQERAAQRVATLDQDATLVETSKREALRCYKGFNSYQPLSTWWAEQRVVLHTEFRDGNVPAGHEQLRVLQEALGALPAGVQTVRLRSDTAGYQHDLMRYCDKSDNKRWGRIEFAIGCDVSQEFKKAVAELTDSEWAPLDKIIEGQIIKTNQQWAEVCFVPEAIGRSKSAPVYRYFAIREPLGSAYLPGTESLLEQLPFPTMVVETQPYKVFGMVTNRQGDGADLIRWHRERCGKSEEAHAVMKSDLAGGQLPSGCFGANAAWWSIMILALNLNAVMKQLALGKGWVRSRLKLIRYSLIDLPGRIIERSGQLIIRLARQDYALALLLTARRRIQALASLPAG
jgi:Transposase DDE domain group 1